MSFQISPQHFYFLLIVHYFSYLVGFRSGVKYDTAPQTHLCHLLPELLSGMRSN